jgi:hypothetical protein
MPQVRAQRRPAPPSRREAERKRIRGMQTFLLLVGGFMILFGSMLANSAKGLAEGMSALHKGDLPTAIASFREDAKRNPDRVESRIALICCLLSGSKEAGSGSDAPGAGRGAYTEAESLWTWLNTRPKELENAKTPDGGTRVYLTEPTRLVEWARQDPRSARSFEGYKLWAQAWLAAERHIRAVRRGAVNADEDSMRQAQDEAAEKLRVFVTAVEGMPAEADDGKAVVPDSGAAPGLKTGQKPASDSGPQVASIAPKGWWTKRYAELRARIAETPLATDMERGQAALRTPKRDVVTESTEALQAAMTPWLARAKEESPEKVEVRAWWLCVASELYRRDAAVSADSGAKADANAGAKAREVLSAGLEDEIAGNPMPRAAGDGKGAGGGDAAPAAAPLKGNGLRSLDPKLFEINPGAGSRLLLGKAGAAMALFMTSTGDEAAQLRAFASEALAMAEARIRGLGSAHPDLGSLEATLASMRQILNEIVGGGSKSGEGGKTK